MKIINLYGGPGVGKSTIAAGLYARMKKEGHKVELATEYAKELVYQNRLHEMCSEQEYIFAHQNYKLRQLRKHVDYAITDSPLLLSNVYADPKWVSYDRFRDFVGSVYKSYENISFVLERTVDYREDGRIHTIEQALEIDRKLQSVLFAYALEKIHKISVDDQVIDNIYNIVIQ